MLVKYLVRFVEVIDDENQSKRITKVKANYQA